MTPQSRDWVESLASALASFGIAAWILWHYSGATEEEWRAAFNALFLLEFLALHSGGFMGALGAKCRTWRGRAICFGILLSMYALFAVIAAVAWKAPEILYGYGVLMAGRFISLVLDADIGNKSRIVFRSAAGIMLMIAIFGGAALLASGLPGFTVNLAVWSVYFVAMGLFELFARNLHEKAKPWRTF